MKLKNQMLSIACCGLLLGNIVYADTCLNSNVESIKISLSDSDDGGGATTPNPGDVGIADANIKKVEVSKDGEDYNHNIKLKPGQKFEVNVKVENKGDATFKDARTYLYITSTKGDNLAGDEPFKKDAKKDIADLDAGESRVDHMKNMKAPTKPGRYYIYAWTKSLADSSDEDYGNNYSRVKDREEYATVDVIAPKVSKSSNIKVVKVRYVGKLVEGSKIGIKYHLRNDGPATVEGTLCDTIRLFSSDWSYEVIDKKVCHKVKTFKKTHGRNYTVNFTAPTTGFYHVVVRTDVDHTFSKKGNYGEFGLTIKPKPKPDIIVTEIRTMHWTRECDADQGLWYSIKNIGRKYFGSVVSIKVEITDTDNKTFEFNQGVYLKPGQEYRYFPINLNGMHYGPHDIKVTVNSEHTAVESNYGNNSRSLHYAVFQEIKPVPVYRFYHPLAKVHHYRTNPAYMGYGWKREESPFKAYNQQKQGTVPIYSCWNPQRLSPSKEIAESGCHGNTWIAFLLRDRSKKCV